jgi:hypothetical protein
MNVGPYSRRLAAQADAISLILEQVGAEQSRWRPSAGGWSLVEVVHHLLDEEREDFRARLRHLFSGADYPWPPIAPQEWVTERNYQSRDLPPLVKEFLRERKESLAWLARQKDVDWHLAYRHAPQAGLTAGDLLVSWATHDLLHLRQIVELKGGFAQTQSAPFRTNYAGEW